MMELFQRKAGITLVHVPYKGTSPAMQALVSGEAAAFNIGIGLARPHITSGKVRALAKTGFPSKDALPDVPPLTSSYPEAEYKSLAGRVRAERHARNVISKLNAALGPRRWRRPM